MDAQEPHHWRKFSRHMSYYAKMAGEVSPAPRAMPRRMATFYVPKAVAENR